MIIENFEIQWVFDIHSVYFNPQMTDSPVKNSFGIIINEMIINDAIQNMNP